MATYKFSRLLTALVRFGGKIHFSNYGEDVILHRLFPRKYKNGVYLDLGAYHPFKFSNTAYFWLKGWSGVNVDANSKSIELFKKIRKKDVNMWGAIVPASYNKSTIVMKSTAKGIDAEGSCSPERSGDKRFMYESTVPALKLEDVFSRLENKKIDFLNIDLEGMDEIIIQEVDFNTYRPKVVCIEVYGYSLDDVLLSNSTVRLKSYGYTPIARIGHSMIFENKNSAG